jgi:hypothetical protein
LTPPKRKLTYLALNLTQTVEKPNKQTLFGSAYMPWTEDLGDGRIGASGKVDVTSATA